jgi:isopenicillin N synthase-like dioxygenase
VKVSQYCSRRLLTVHVVDWADLTFIDLAKAKTPEGRAEQVRLARDATHRQGFFYVINHGLDQAVVSYN